MRKIIAILCVCLLLTGCGTKCEDAEDASKEPEPYGEYFTLIKEWYDVTGFEYEIVYANDTGVKYLIIKSYYKGGITPLYNADGSLQVYKESEEEE